VRELATDRFVMLDPAVDVENIEPPSTSRGGCILLHDALECAAILPSGQGLRSFVEDLRTPTRIADLVDAQDIASDTIAWQLLRGLVDRGFAHPLDRGDPADDTELATLRRAWHDGSRARRTLHIEQHERVEEVLARLRALTSAPILEIEHRDDVDDVIEQLARARDKGELVAYPIVVSLPSTIDPACLGSLRRLGATARLEVSADGSIPNDLVRALGALHVPITIRWQLADLGASFAPAHRLAAEGVTSIELDVPWLRLGQDDAAERAAALYARFEALADELGDVTFRGLPTDEQIAQEAVFEGPPSGCDLERAVRALHLRRRARHLSGMEARMVWGQDPEAEQLWVPLEDDLLPDHPRLLALHDGAVLVDVAGGYGRVARRIAPQVGPTGLVISIEKEPIFSARARRFAAALGARTVQCRIGLGQRLPLPDSSCDAAVMEWGGAIHREGLLARCLAEMFRVVRTGGRIAISYQLCNLELTDVSDVKTNYPTIYDSLREVMSGAGLAIKRERIWGVRPQISGAPRAAFEERFLPRLIDDLRCRTMPRQRPSVDVMITFVAEKHGV
jgi:SAM-dependent methyltransferase